jgi:formate dehydrogenase maturation protein FdhE
MTSRGLAYPDAIHISRDELVRRKCVQCHSVGSPNVYIMIVNGQHYLKCSSCKIAMYSPHNI